MAESTISVRPFADTDLAQVLDVLRASLGETSLLQRTPELFAWKHLSNPFGRSIILVAEADDRIVGLRAFMRWELLTPSGDTLRCVRAVDTATHPDYQRRGIFRTLTMAAVEEARTDGVNLIFNTPNPKSGAGYLRMGWRPVGDIGVLAVPTRGMLRGRVAGDELPPPDDFITDPAPVGDLSVDDRPALGMRTPRTDAYVRWRFTEHPTARYVRVDGDGATAIVRPNVRGGRRELVISDVFGPRPARAIGRTIARSRAAYVGGWFSKGSPERTAAIRRGMVAVPRMTALTLVANPLTDMPSDVGSLAAWDIASSDLELL
jgi:GNAT superfamily N-acetyltransferase